MELSPGLLMLAMALTYLACEITLRKRTGGQKGPLNWATRPIVLAPLGIYLTAAVIFSTGSWSILNLTSVLIVFGLPVALAASYRAFRPEVPLGISAAVAVGLSLLGLATVWLGSLG